MELERLGKYELVERLGRGGMGEVWKARDTQLRRFVAIKLLHADLQANPDFVTHFMREAQLVASLHHPNIVQIHDFQLANTEGSSIKAYMVMDYIQGGTLADYISTTIRKGHFPPAADIVHLFTSIGLALDYAHSKRMIHRDIKPANILLDTSSPTGKAPIEPILTDFGIARLQGASASTVTSSLLGTPRYISPEQAEGHAIDERSDLYSLGIVLYEILTGVTPFHADSPIAIMMQHVHERPTPPNLINANITPALSAVVLQSIAKDPAARFPSATAMTSALAQAFGLSVSANKPGSATEQPGYNPLQPVPPLPGTTPYVRTFTPASPAPIIPVSAGFPEAQFVSPTHYTPATSDSGKREMRPPQSATSTRLRRRNLYFALIGCALLLLLGISTFSLLPQLLSKNAVHSTPTPVSASAIVGNIVFMHSPNAPSNVFDQLRITLQNIPTPPSGTTYYAWLKLATSDTVEYPHWPLQVTNGSIQGLYSNAAQHTDLFAQSNLFLITTEDTTIAPDIPLPDLSHHLYYATITHTSTMSPTFEVKQCPQNGASNAANPC